MAREAFSYKKKEELKDMNLLELNVYIAELRRRAEWVAGAVRKSHEEFLAEALKARDAKRSNR